MTPQSPRLGVNIDHIATIRNARGGDNPDPVRGALIAMEHGADGITAHLREDRRHIRDEDMSRLRAEVPLKLNFEMAVTEEMLTLAREISPHACCLVPENRAEITTEGGLDAIAAGNVLPDYVARLADAGIRVSLFIDPDVAQVEMAARVKAPVIELHTGRFCEATGEERARELKRLTEAARVAEELGIECHAGHGLTFDTIAPVAAIPQILEFNIGHFLVGEGVMIGFGPAVAEMKRLIIQARQAAFA
ncbi:pyridoxine 5'-phosphate synthase [Acuticoccus sp. MNP-M23]|uniref:pyridoxine 5'-phosphate synthase n=1 Tax=Acuticoccus sp. MNP-M23 TaxID=3072793 RepID=UPI002815B4ED|nr:pyridoxine 5'-phosphate synthase [Acuticoccus sp. MNP-M23]WMS44304.1 pyridoxine 5'-phosphate synthase [Acuticoccus sp. MNP-M23]